MMKKLAEVGIASFIALGLSAMLFLIWTIGTGDFSRIFGA